MNATPIARAGRRHVARALGALTAAVVMTLLTVSPLTPSTTTHRT